nr:protein rrp6-like 2 [Quercus suber]
MNEHHHHRDEVEAEADKAQTLASSLSKLSASSRGVPFGKDFHFLNNFDDFKNPIREISNKSTSMLHTINDNAQVWRQQAATAFPDCPKLLLLSLKQTWTTPTTGRGE